MGAGIECRRTIICDAGRWTWFLWAIGGPGRKTDVLIHNANPSSVLPAGYTAWRRIELVLRVSSALLWFRRIGDYVSLAAPVNETVGQMFDSSQRTYSLTVPVGLEVLADVAIATYNGSMISLVAGHPSASLTLPSNPAIFPSQPVIGGATSNTAYVYATKVVPTDTSGRIAIRASGTATSSDIFTFGWWDPRT